MRLLEAVNVVNTHQCIKRVSWPTGKVCWWWPIGHFIYGCDNIVTRRITEEDEKADDWVLLTEEQEAYEEENSVDDPWNIGCPWIVNRY
jgi:hypothetical protein